MPRVADWLGGGTLSLLTEKPDGKNFRLNLSSRDWARAIEINPIVILDDVGTTGRNAAEVIKLTRGVGISKIEVLYTWQRREKLEELEAIGISPKNVIYDLRPTFTKKECETLENGFCAQGWELKE